MGEVHIVRRAGIVLVAAVLCWGVFTAPAVGAVLGIEARVTTSVQELADGQAASISADEDEFDPIDLNFPLSAVAALTSTDLDGFVTSLGRSISTLDDPRGAAAENPQEFGLEAIGFSNEEGASHTIRSSGRETRTLVFSSSADVDPIPIDFNPDGTRILESEVFLSGALLVWSTDGVADLGDLLGELHFSITRNGETQPLFEAAILLDDAAVAGNDPVVIGQVSYEVGGVDLLQAGADDRIRQALDSLERSADVTVVLISLQSHTYEYEVVEDEELSLTANFEAIVRSAPGGSGVAAAWGKEFESLASILEQAIPTADGSLIQAVLNSKMNEGSPDPSAQPSAPVTPVGSPRFCGAMGGVPLLVLPLLFLARIGRSCKGL